MEGVNIPIVDKREIENSIGRLISDIKVYMPEFNEQKFLRSYTFASKAHEGQLRKGGEPYITHPLATAKILSSLHVDEDTLIAAILHDVPEDTDRTIEDVQKRFGKRVAFLVEGITKLSKVHYQKNMKKRQIESLRKLFIHSAKDPRIIIIKLADRLHNMRTLQFIDNPLKRERIAKETLEIFVPIANLLGIEELKSELEDLCFRSLLPDDYHLLSDRLKTSREKNKKALDKMIERLETIFRKNGLSTSIYGRRKNIYGIYKRIYSEQSKLQDYDDFLALRIIVPNLEDCYTVLGIIHGNFKPKTGKFKDYIAVPKRNGYQSLHTTVFGIGGLNTEFQIRTHQMHLEAEYGIAATYFEKSKHRNPHLEADSRTNWTLKILEYNNRANDDESDSFMENLKLDILHDRIFVFTPKGDCIDLPQGATCIDFAYEIHTEVGHRAINAEINGSTVPMSSALQNGDTVNIITSDLPKSPNRHWLAFVKTNAARNRILDYFKKISREEKITNGKELLQKELDRAGLGKIRDLPGKKVKAFCQLQNDCRGIDGLLEKIGEGSLSAVEFISQVYPTVDRSGKTRISRSRPPSKTLVSMKVTSRNSPQIITRLLQLLEIQNISVIKIKSYLSPLNASLVCRISFLAESFSQISSLFEAVEQIEGVTNVERMFWQRKLQFILGSILTFIIWAIHPFLVHFIAIDLGIDVLHPVQANMLLYAGLLMLFLVVLSLKKITQRSFPEMRENRNFWFFTFLLIAFAIITLFAEIYFFQINYDWFIVFASIIGILVYRLSEFVIEMVKHPHTEKK